MTLHDAGKSQEAGSGTGTEQGYPKALSPWQLRGKGHTQEGLGYSFSFGIRFPTAQNETIPWLCFCQGRVKSPKVSEEDWVGICSEFHSSGPVLLCVEFN